MKPRYCSLIGYEQGARKIHVHLSEFFPPVSKNHSSYKHRHRAEEVFYILSGKAVCDVDGRKIRMAAGDIVLFPSGSRHGIERIQSDRLKYLVIRSVARGEAPCCCGKDKPPGKKAIQRKVDAFFRKKKRG